MICKLATGWLDLWSTSFSGQRRASLWLVLWLGCVNPRNW